MLFQLGFKAFEKGKGIGSAAGKTGDHLIFVKAADLAGIAFHNGVAEAHLTIAADHYLAIASHGQNGCTTILFHLTVYL